jgi:hypothetical protein
MKVLINENQKEKVNNLIYQTIDSMFDIDEMIPVDREDYVRYPIKIISPDDEIFFWIYFPQYWSDDTYLSIERKKRSPILQLGVEYDDKLNRLFGNLWHEQMINWVENNFPFLPLIKSVKLNP